MQTNSWITCQTTRGQPFWDATALPSPFSSTLPDPLRIKVNGVQPNQIGVYEDFGEYFLGIMGGALDTEHGV